MKSQVRWLTKIKLKQKTEDQTEEMLPYAVKLSYRAKNHEQRVGISIQYSLQQLINYNSG